MCLFDPRHLGVGRKLSEATYFAPITVSSFANPGGPIDGAALIATIPAWSPST